MAKRHTHVGISLDELLEEEGLTEEVNAILQKRQIAAQLRAAMVRGKVSEAALARRLGTSRTQVRRLLDPTDDSATIHSLARAAGAVGGVLTMAIRAAPRRARKRTKAAR
jgi:hypothetical protein